MVFKQSGVFEVINAKFENDVNMYGIQTGSQEEHEGK